MSFQDRSLLPADLRPLQLRRRRDLLLQESFFQGERCWIVKDPLAMKYFRLLEPERLALLQLDGPTSIRQIKQALDGAFPDRSFRVEDIQQLVTQFHQQGLLVSDAEDQAAPLGKRRGKELRQKALGLLTSVLALRLPGVDPDRFLNAIYPRVRWFFSLAFLAVAAALVASAALLILQNLDEFYRRLPDFYQFFGFRNLLLMGAILIVTKSLHELGHGLMCKHFGGECHEIGFMLLVLTPAMYCNTSDSWILPNKWHRMAIGAAGMYVEILLAAACTFVWWYTQPGWLHYLALNIIFLCSVSTVIFNANPLLRYDGYYILADWLEIPNLAQKARLSMLNRLRTLALGMEPVPQRFLPQRGQTLFAVYNVASFLYRWFVYLSIMLFLSKVFEPYGLEVLGYLMISFSLVGLVVVPAYRLFKFFRTPGRWRQVKKARLALSAAAAAAALFYVAGIPLPHYIYAPFVLRPDEAASVYVAVEGTIAEIAVQPGEAVQAGDRLLRLENPALQLELQRLAGHRQSLARQIESLQLLAGQAPETTARLGPLVAELQDTERQIELRRLDLQRLTIVAPRTGTVFPPPPLSPTARQLSQVHWTRTPLDRENVGGLLPEQTLVAIIGHPTRRRAVLLVEQSDVQFLQPGQAVQLMLDEDRGRRIRAALAALSQNEAALLPPELSTSHGGPIGGVPLPGGDESPQLTYFEAFVPLGDLPLNASPGFRGLAKIRVADATLGGRLARFLRTAFHFR